MTPLVVRRLLGAACAVVVSVGAASCGIVPQLPRPTPRSASAGMPSPSTSTSTPIAVGLTQIPVARRALAPSLGGPTLTGSTLDIANLRGRIVVVNAWASWCDPCRGELPDLAAAARSNDPKLVTFVGLNVEDSLDGARSMSASAGLPYPSIVDAHGAMLARIPGVPPAAIPSTVVLDRQGRVAATVVGTVTPAALASTIAALVAERA